MSPPARDLVVVPASFLPRCRRRSARYTSWYLVFRRSVVKANVCTFLAVLFPLITLFHLIWLPVRFFFFFFPQSGVWRKQKMPNNFLEFVLVREHSGELCICILFDFCFVFIETCGRSQGWLFMSIHYTMLRYSILFKSHVSVFTLLFSHRWGSTSAQDELDQRQQQPHVPIVLRKLQHSCAPAPLPQLWRALLRRLQFQGTYIFYTIFFLSFFWYLRLLQEMASEDLEFQSLAK